MAQETSPLPPLLDRPGKARHRIQNGAGILAAPLIRRRAIMAIATTSAGWRSLICLTLTGTIFQRTSNARSAVGSVMSVLGSIGPRSSISASPVVFNVLVYQV